MPVAARTAQNMLPVVTPSARARADERPWLIATPMMAMLLGPGLAVAIR